MSRNTLKTAIATVLFGCAAMAGNALAAPPCGTPPCGGGPPDKESSAGNNLSFPVIFSDGSPPGGATGEGYTDITPEQWLFYSDPWTDANGDGVYDQCTTGVPVGSPVPEQYICYQMADLKVWWLQERTVNKWQAFDPRNDATGGIDMGDVIVSAVDWGDLLESSPSLNARKIRTEVWLLRHVPETGDPLSDYLSVKDNGTASCPSGQDECLVAFRMSGAVPGTEQSINEVQGTDYGPGVGNEPGTGAFIDPASVKFDGGTPPVGYEATVYSTCARLLIQPYEAGAVPSWDSDSGTWTGTGVGGPVVNIRALDGGYSAEVNAGGFMLYGYNWSAKGLDLGTYRLTFVLDGPESAYACPDLQTYFDGNTRVFVTPAAEPELPGTEAEGEGPEAVILPNCGLVGEGVDCVDNEGGLSYIDVEITKSGGGGGGNKPN